LKLGTLKAKSWSNLVRKHNQKNIVKKRVSKNKLKMLKRGIIRCFSNLRGSGSNPIQNNGVRVGVTRAHQLVATRAFGIGEESV
jgi:hypothetical protein